MTVYLYFISLLCCGFIVQMNGLFHMRGLFSSITDYDLQMERVVKGTGFPFELHHVTTKDGYILSVHRIPSNNTNGNAPNRRVVLIMHGLLGCSADWVVPSRNRSIAYLLADNGYDVWLGNSRGTTASKNHTTLSMDSSQFWDFSWHEMGVYDLPAMIDYILAQTGQKQLFYVGFSQGTTQFWILMSLRPEYNEKIKLMSALAPVAYVGHIMGSMRPGSVFANFFKPIYRYTGFFEMCSNTPFMRFLTQNFCQEGMPTQYLCELITFAIGGTSTEINHAHFAEYIKFIPGGCSYKQLVHYALGIQNPGHFRPYDYGALKNLVVYGQFVPPEYPLEKISAPVILYNGLNDFLAHPEDVDLLSRKLPNMLEKYTVTTKGLNHFDFMFAINIREYVYDHLIMKMNSIP